MWWKWVGGLGAVVIVVTRKSEMVVGCGILCWFLWGRPRVAGGDGKSLEGCSVDGTTSETTKVTPCENWRKL